MLIKCVVLYLVVMNTVGFAAMWRDKRRAAARRFRTPEKRLLAYTALGGSVGTILGMVVFRHKTRHLKFTLGLPVILILQLSAAIAVVVLI